MARLEGFHGVHSRERGFNKEIEIQRKREPAALTAAKTSVRQETEPI